MKWDTTLVTSSKIVSEENSVFSWYMDRFYLVFFGRLFGDGNAAKIRENHGKFFMDDDSDYEPESGDSSDDSDGNDSDFDQQTSPDPRVGSIFSFSCFGLMHCVLTLFFL